MDLNAGSGSLSEVKKNVSTKMIEAIYLNSRPEEQIERLIALKRIKYSTITL